MSNVKVGNVRIELLAALALAMVVGASFAVGLKRDEAVDRLDFVCYTDGEETRRMTGVEAMRVNNSGQASEVWTLMTVAGERRVAPLPGELCGPG